MPRTSCADPEGTRELIAAYVSGLNGSAHCYGSHCAVAATFGVDPGVVAGLLEGDDQASNGVSEFSRGMPFSLDPAAAIMGAPVT